MMQHDDIILITGGSGLAGLNLKEYLQSQGFNKIFSPTSSECDLTQRQTVIEYFKRHKPAYVFHMAGFVRGIGFNAHNHGEAYLKNTLINTHVVEACHAAGVKKVLAMGSAAMYPDPAGETPLREEDVWKGPPHQSQYGYAQAKRGMLAQLQAYESSYGMPYAFAFCSNLYGPYDRFNTENGHVIPSLIKKFYDARQTNAKVTIWGDGSAHRDFLYIDDCSRALHTIMDHITGPLNLASGATRRVRDVVEILGAHSGMKDRIVWDSGKPNGHLYRAYDVHRLAEAGFACRHTLEDALPVTFDWYARNNASARN